jgi:hypothetical protein
MDEFEEAIPKLPICLHIYRIPSILTFSGILLENLILRETGWLRDIEEYIVT